MLRPRCGTLTDAVRPALRDAMPRAARPIGVCQGWRRRSHRVIASTRRPRNDDDKPATEVAHGRATFRRGGDATSAPLGPLATRSALTEWALEAARRTVGFGTDVGATLSWCIDVGKRAPHVGTGRTRELWELLAETAALDVSAARMLEPHLDALSILGQAGLGSGTDHDDSDLERVRARVGSTWGVFAAEGAGERLDAVADGDGWRLRGTKPWCSLAAHLSHALVTASVDGGERGLFAVDLRDARVNAHDGPWFARGLPDVVSTAVDFDGAPAVAVGDAGWYLTRPGFAWGGMSVAACWWGAARGHRGAAAGRRALRARGPARPRASRPRGCRTLGGARRAC